MTKKYLLWLFTAIVAIALTACESQKKHRTDDDDDDEPSSKTKTSDAVSAVTYDAIELFGQDSTDVIKQLEKAGFKRADSEGAKAPVHRGPAEKKFDVIYMTYGGAMYYSGIMDAALALNESFSKGGMWVVVDLSFDEGKLAIVGASFAVGMPDGKDPTTSFFKALSDKIVGWNKETAIFTSWKGEIQLTPSMYGPTTYVYPETYTEFMDQLAADTAGYYADEQGYTILNENLDGMYYDLHWTRANKELLAIYEESGWTVEFCSGGSTVADYHYYYGGK